MLNMYRWQREQAVASELRERSNRHAYVMEKEEVAEDTHVSVRVAEKLHSLAFHLAPNTHWTREVMTKPAA